MLLLAMATTSFQGKAGCCISPPYPHLSFGEERVPMTYDFPEIIITGRGSVVRQWSNKFLGLSVVFTYTDIGKAENLTVNNNKWRIRTFFGWRL